MWLRMAVTIPSSGRGRGTALEFAHNALSDFNPDGLQGGHKISQESCWLTILLLQRQPGDGRRESLIHWLSSVVLPRPAEAEIIVSLRADAPSFKRSIRRRRRTALDRGEGIYNFVDKIGVDIITPLCRHCRFFNIYIMIKCSTANRFSLLSAIFACCSQTQKHDLQGVAYDVSEMLEAL